MQSGFRLALILLICLGLIAWGVWAVAAQGARVRLAPATLDLAPGDVRALEVRVEGVDRLAGAEVHLIFDPTLLEVVDADPASTGVQIDHGDFLSPDFVAQNVVDPARGTVDYAIACLPLDKAVSGDGVLARVTFRALARGKAPVEVDGVLLADDEGKTIVVEVDSGMVVVGRPGLPVINTIGLVVIVAGAVAVLWKIALSPHQKGGNE